MSDKPRMVPVTDANTRMWLLASIAAAIVVALYVAAYGWPEVLKEWFQ